MASVKVKFRAASHDDMRGFISYQVIHCRVVRVVSSGFGISVSEWDSERSMVRPECGHIREQIAFDLDRFARIIGLLGRGGMAFTCDDIVDAFKCFRRRWSMFRVLEASILKLKEHRRIRTAAAYRQALNSFCGFRHGVDILIDELTPEIIEDYQLNLRARGNSLNTVSFYMRILRAAYNRAVESAAVENRHPFRRVFTGLAKTRKRAVPIAIIKRIKNLDLANDAELDFARDMFLLSFYLRGMSLVDMAFLRKTGLRDGRVVYRRHKTGQTLEIEWRHEMQAILDKYPPNPTQYLLPIIRKEGINEHVAYRKVGCKINRQLKMIADMVGVPGGLTLYVARHSWASAAKSKHIPIGVICEAMGHDSETTTQIYLASLETSVVDRANSLILSSL